MRIAKAGSAARPNSRLGKGVSAAQMSGRPDVRAAGRSSSNGASFSRSSSACLRAVLPRVVDTTAISSPLSSRRRIFVTDIQMLFPATVNSLVYRLNHGF